MVLGYYYIDTLRGFDSPIALQTKSPSERSSRERFGFRFVSSLLNKRKPYIHKRSHAFHFQGSGNAFLIMKDILDKLLSKLDRELTASRENNPSDTSTAGRFKFGRHIIRFIFNEDGCEVEVFNPILDTFLDNVSFFLEERCILWNQIDVEETDEWDAHGFRDEADYINWRYR